METIFATASSVSTPLALGGIFAVIVFFIFRAIINRDIFPQLAGSQAKEIIQQMIIYLFYLALVAIVLGVAAYLLEIYFRKQQPPAVPVPAATPPAGTGATASKPSKILRSPITTWELEKLNTQMDGLITRIRSDPVSLLSMRPVVQKWAELLWNERSISVQAARGSAIAYRLYAGCYLMDASKSKEAQIPDATSWLRRSLAQYIEFTDQKKLEAASAFFLNLQLHGIDGVAVRDLARHQFRIIMVEASDADIEALVIKAEDAVLQEYRQKPTK